MKSLQSALSKPVTRLKDHDRQKLTINKRERQKSYLLDKMPKRIWSDAEGKFVDMTDDDLLKYGLHCLNKARNR